MTNKTMQTQPHNLEVEMAVLGSMLIEDQAISKTAERLSAVDFYKDAHKTIFSAILQLHEAHKAVDLITLVEKLKNDGTLEAIGGASYLAGLSNTVPTADNIEHYAQIVKQKSVLRLLIAQAAQISDEAYTTEDGAEAITQRAVQSIATIAEKCASGPGSGEGPVALDAYLKSAIPPVQYFIDPILPVKGKMMISACSNVGKSIFAMNMCLTMTSSIEKIFDKWTVKPARVLYVDLEMGDSPMKERFAKMCAAKNIATDLLFVKHIPCLNLLEATESKTLKTWIKDLGVDVLVLDPLGHAWAGNENSAEDVIQITRELNKIIDEFGVSIVLVHHWRKATKDFKDGGEMAAGSYRWTAWLDSHLCLKGESDSIHVTCEKNRHAGKFKPWVARINEEDLWIEHVADHGGHEKKLSLETFDWLYNTAKEKQNGDLVQLDGVLFKTIMQLAKEQKMGSRPTLLKFLEENRAAYTYGTEGAGKPSIVTRVNDPGAHQEDLAPRVENA